MAVIDQPVEVSEHERLKIAVLRWVNDLRGEYNAEPLAELPQGIPGVAWACVITQAVHPISDGSAPVPFRPRCAPPGLTFARDGKVQTRPVADEVVEFAMRFDAGEYPELLLYELVL